MTRTNRFCSFTRATLKRKLLSIVFACGVITLSTSLHANVDVYLNFDSGGAGTFLADLNTAAANAGLGANYFNAGDAAAISAQVKTSMEAIYNGFDVTFFTAPQAGATSVKFAEAGGGFGAAPFDWRDAFYAPNTKAARIFTRNFDPTLAGAANKADAINRIAIGLSGTGAHELGHTFGLDHEDSYGIPGITPANYANTAGLQNSQIMATGPTGLSDNRSTPRAFGQLERAKLEYANSVGTGVPFLANETAAAHGSKATAQGLTFADIPSSGLRVRDVANAKIGTSVEQDWYSFIGAAGQSLTAQAFSYLDATTGFFSDSVDTVLDLYRSDGTTLLATDDDMHYQDNDISAAATTQSRDAWMLNVQLPANETYYLRVTSTGTDTTGSYELFVAVPEPSAIMLLGLGGLLFCARRIRPRANPR